MGKGIRELIKERVVLLDGAMGTALMERGLKLGAPGECWNVDRPDEILLVQSAYVAAGSDVIQTNTFGGSPLRLASHALEDRMEAINLAAAKIAREAAGENRLVAGNIGPSGTFLPPVGEGDPDAMEACYAAQAKVLARGGVDYISIETMIDLKEALLALKGALRGAPELPVSVTMVFEKKKRGFFSPMGDTPAGSARTLAEAGADLVGANCSMGSGEMLELVGDMVQESPVPVVMKPNAGMPETRGDRTIYHQTPEAFAADLMSMVERGARAVGGCCGTDTRFIAALRRELDKGA